MKKGDAHSQGKWKRYAVLFSFLLLLFVACNNSGSDRSNATSQNYNANGKDTALMLQTAQSILQLIQSRQYKDLVAYVHPEWGLRCSPYAFVDTINDVVLMTEDLENNNHEQHLWGYYDGTGDPIMLNTEAYFNQFVYDRNFIAAPNVSINRILGKGNSVNNLQAAYPECDFIEYYFPGTEDYPDWRALRLVFKQYQGRLYLVGLVHDQWTI